MGLCRVRRALGLGVFPLQCGELCQGVFPLQCGKLCQGVFPLQCGELCQGVFPARCGELGLSMFLAMRGGKTKLIGDGTVDNFVKNDRSKTT
jgi:hypothetical protein